MTVLGYEFSYYNYKVIKETKDPFIKLTFLNDLFFFEKVNSSGSYFTDSLEEILENELEGNLFFSGSLETMIIGENIELLDENKTIRELKEEIRDKYYEYSIRDKEEPEFFSI